MKGPLKIQIDTKSTRHNIRLLKERFKGIEIIAVLKEIAYGHDMLEMAKICQEEGIDGIALILVKEGVYLRQNAIKLPIYLLSRVPEREIELAIDNELIFPMNTIAEIEFVGKYLNEHPDKQALISMPINTGMNRYGFSKEEAIKACNLIKTIPNLKLVQVYSHLTHADDKVDPYSREQFEIFQDVLKDLPDLGFKRSIANSAASVRYDDMFLDQIRVGCLLHGLDPVDGEPLPSDLPLTTGYTCRSEINHIHHLKAGESTSYGRDFTATEDTWIAAIVGGYGNGIAKSLSNNGEVLIKGKRYPIIGRVCMSQFIVNLGPDTDLKVGDTVTIIGQDGDENINIFEHADWADRNFLEIMINMSAHNELEILK